MDKDLSEDWPENADGVVKCPCCKENIAPTGDALKFCPQCSYQLDSRSYEEIRAEAIKKDPAYQLGVLRKQVEDERMRNRRQLQKFIGDTEEVVKQKVRDWVMEEIEQCAENGSFVDEVIERVYTLFSERFDEWVESRKLRNRIKAIFGRFTSGA